MITKSDKRLGKSIKKYRKKVGLTQEELANKIRVTPKYIQFIESARRTPSLKLLKKMSKILKIKVKEILPY